MMKSLLTLLLLAIVSFSYAQHKETRKISKISGISVASGIQAKFIKSSKNEVVVDVSREDILPKIETIVRNGNLQIKVKNGSEIRNANSLKVTVYSNSVIKSINLSSAGNLEILDAIDVSDFSADISSAGKLKTGKITANNTTLNLSSAGKMNSDLMSEKLSINTSSAGEVTLSGMSKQLKVNMSSNGKALLNNFKTSTLEVNGSSGAVLNVEVINSIDATVSSGAKVIYSGNPVTKDINKSSGGTVSRD